MTRASRALAAVLALAGVAACARQGTPTGGIQDRVPPVVVLVEPEPFALVPPDTDRLRVRFNERISEQVATGRLEDVVLISPEVSALEVEHKRDGLDIYIPDGLRAGIAYTVRIVPQIRDMFGNPMAVPFEWAFSTGGTFHENAVVGQIWDRATGESLPDVRVTLVPDAGEGGDTLRYAVTSGPDGLYALRTLPPARFQMVAFLDRNRNRTPDPTEPRGAVQDSLGTADTVFLSIPILVPDTTPATLAQAEALDSAVVRLFFDDLLDPTASLDTVAVSFARDTAALDPAIPLPGPGPRFHEWEWVAYRDSLALAADSALADAIEAARAAGDSARADSLAQAGPRPVPGGPRGSAAARSSGRSGGGETLPDGTPRPANSIVVLLNGVLAPDVPVLVRVGGAVNLNGLAAGGGEASVFWTPVPPDSISVPDTTGLVPDTTASVGVPGRVSRDPLFPRR